MKGCRVDDVKFCFLSQENSTSDKNTRFGNTEEACTKKAIRLSVSFLKVAKATERQ